MCIKVEGVSDCKKRKNYLTFCILDRSIREKEVGKVVKLMSILPRKLTPSVQLVGKGLN